MSTTTQKNPALRNAGFVLFFLSGICAISSGVVVSILRDSYDLSFSSTGTLLSIMSAGNIVASFLAGVLPAKIGAKKAVLLLTIGYFLGYLLYTFTGIFGLLAIAFLIIGLAKGSAITNCNVLVSTNAIERTRAMNVLHACYAAGVLLCPFLIQAFLGIDAHAPMIGIALAGLLIAFVFPVKNLYKTLSIMGLGLTVLYAILVQMHTPVAASVALFLFAFAMAGVNPLALAGVGQMTSPASMGTLLSTATCGAILKPYIIGRIGDAISLQAGMAANLVPCIGILVLSLLMYHRTKKQ